MPGYKSSLFALNVVFAFLIGAIRADDVPLETRPERASRQERDRASLQAIVNGGADLAKPHDIEFHFIGQNEARIRAVAAAGKSLGYRASEIDRLGVRTGLTYWHFNLVQRISPSEQAIATHSEAMAALAKKYGVEFDGWGCLIVP